MMKVAICGILLGVLLIALLLFGVIHN